MKKNIVYFLLIPVLLAGMLTVSACFSPYQGDKGTFSINLGGGGGSSRNTSLPWNPTGSSPYIEDLLHIITLFGGPGPDHTVSVQGLSTVNFSVTPGVWEISIEGFEFASGEWVPVSMGYTKVNIKPGSNGDISIKMEEFIP